MYDMKIRIRGLTIFVLFRRFSNNLIAVSFIFLSACNTTTVSEGYAQTDTWWRAMEVSEHGWLLPTNALLTSEFQVIPLERQEKYVSMLRDRQWILVDHDIMNELSSSIHISHGSHLYIVRGLTLNMGTGSYELYFSKGRLYISYGALGRSSRPAKREAILVSVPEPLVALYVVYGLGE